MRTTTPATGPDAPPHPSQVPRAPEVLELAAALAGAARLRARTAFETLVQFSSVDIRFWSHIMLYATKDDEHDPNIVPSV